MRATHRTVRERAEPQRSCGLACDRHTCHRDWLEEPCVLVHSAPTLPAECASASAGDPHLSSPGLECAERCRTGPKALGGSSAHFDRPALARMHRHLRRCAAPIICVPSYPVSCRGARERRWRRRSGSARAATTSTAFTAFTTLTTWRKKTLLDDPPKIAEE